MDKQLIERLREIATDVGKNYCSPDGDLIENAANELARIDSERGKEAVAHVCWGSHGVEIQCSTALTAILGRHAIDPVQVPLYAAPQQPAPCQCECGDYQQSYLEAQSALTVQNKELRKLSAECDALRTDVERLTMERDTEIARNNPLRALAKSQEERIAYLAKNCRGMDEARSTLESERSANEQLTDTIAQQAERIAELEKEINNVYESVAYRRMQTTIAAQSAALAKAREALIAALSDDLPYIVKSKEALAAIGALEQKGCA